MDAVSAVASVIALYQLASEITKLCIKYGQEVRQGSREMRLFVDGITQFQICAARLAQPLEDEGSEGAAQDRLRFLRDVVSEDSQSYRDLVQDLGDLLKQLDKALSSEGIRRQVTKLTWPLKAEDRRRIIERMHVVEAAITKAVTLDTNELLRTIDSRLRANEKISEERQSRLCEEQRRREELEEESTKRKDIQAWLRHPNPSENHSIACAARNDSIQPGLWLIEDPEFKAFRRDKSSLLWLHGYPGCGKTILASLAIDNLVAQKESDDNLYMAFWYFNANDRQRMSIENALRCFISQLMPPEPAKVPKILNEIWQNRGQGQAAAKLSDLSLVLRRLLLEHPSYEYYLVIDAMDEATDDPGDREHLFTVLGDLLSSDELSVHILITSRTQVEISKLFDKLPDCRRSIAIGNQVDRDIKKHIESQLKIIQVQNHWRNSELKRAQKALLDRAGSMFRLVDCQLRELRRCRKPAALDTVLQSLPKDLNEQYERELHKIDDTDAQDALHLLQWLAFPQRKLRIEETVDMLAVNFDTDPPHFSEKDRMYHPRDVLDVCGSLVRIDINKEGRNHLGDVTEVETLTTAHSTVLEFLISRPIRIGSQIEYEFRSGPINLRMAETCLAYLSDLYEKKPKLKEKELVNYHFARYSAEFWDDHYRAAAKDRSLDFTRVNRMIINLLNEVPARIFYVRLCDPDNDEGRVNFGLGRRSVKSPLYYASLHGLKGIVEHYIREGAELNKPHLDDYGTPLIAAAAHGHADVVRLLLDAGADPLLACEEYGYPIAVAVENNRVEVLEILLQQPGVDINSLRMPPEKVARLRAAVEANLTKPQASSCSSSGSISSSSDSSTDNDSDSYSSSLDTAEEAEEARESLVYIAADANAIETLKFLLENGANPNVEGGMHGTPLIAACAQGSEEMVDLLLQFSAEVDICCGDYGSALEAACVNSGCLSILEKLIAKGVDVNLTDSEGDSPLLISCENDEVAYVELLLEHGAAVNPVQENCRLPLEAAACNGNVNIVQQLLAAGAEINRRSDSTNITALYSACRKKAIDVVRVLLEHGADPNLTDCQPLDNAMQCAARTGCEELVELLLKHGADTHLQGGSYGNTLQAAVASRILAVAQKIVQLGVNVRVHGGPFTYPLNRAVDQDNLVMATWLLEQGADPNGLDESESNSKEKYVTPLQLCSSPSMATLLLERGADIDAYHGTLGTALNCMVFDNMYEISRLLLERGADPNRPEKDSKGSTAILRAVGLRRDDLFTMLLAHGADVVYRNRNGFNSVTAAILSGHSERIASLIEKGAGQPKSVDARGVSDLHYAALTGRVGVVRHLLHNYNLDVHVRDRNGWSVLHWAAKNPWGSVAVLKELRARGVDTNLRDLQDRTALDIASSLNLENEALVLQAKSPQEIEAVSDKTDIDRDKRQRKKAKPRWGEHTCSLCDHGIGDRYSCQDCSGYHLCFRCILDKDAVHDPSHSFDCEFRDGNGFPQSNQDPDIPDIPAPNDELDEKAADKSGAVGPAQLAPRLQTTSLKPSEATMVSPETPLELRWLDQRFRPDSNPSVQSASPPPISRGNSLLENRSRGRDADDNNASGTPSRLNTLVSASEYSVTSEENAAQQSKSNGLENAPEELPPPQITKRRPTQDRNAEMAAKESTDTYGPFGLRADTSPTTTAGHLSDLHGRGMFPSIPSFGPSFASPPTAQENDKFSPLEDRPIKAPPPLPYPISDVDPNEWLEGQRQSELQQETSHQQHSQHPGSSGSTLPPGLIVGNGARRHSDSPPKPLPKDTPPQSMILTGQPAPPPSQENRPPVRKIPVGLLPGRPSGQAPPPARAWENRSYNRTSIQPPLPPPKPSQLTGAPSHHGTSSEGRFPLHMYSVPAGAAAPTYSESVSPVSTGPAPTAQTGRPPQRPQGPIRTAYAQHQHAHSLSQLQGPSSASPRLFTQQQPEQPFYPPRQSSLESPDSPLPPPPSLSERAGRHSVIGLASPSGPSSPYNADFASPFGSPPIASPPSVLPMSAPGPGTRPFITSPPSSSYDALPRPPRRPHAGSSSSPQLGTVALPAEVSLGFGRDMSIGTMGDPHEEAVELPATKEPQELAGDHPPPSRAPPNVAELDSQSISRDSDSRRVSKDAPSRSLQHRPAPHSRVPSDPPRGTLQRSPDPRARPFPGALEPATLPTESHKLATASPNAQGGAAARLTAAAARVGAIANLAAAGRANQDPVKMGPTHPPTLRTESAHQIPTAPSKPQLIRSPQSADAISTYARSPDESITLQRKPIGTGTGMGMGMGAGVGFGEEKGVGTVTTITAINLPSGIKPKRIIRPGIASENPNSPHRGTGRGPVRGQTGVEPGSEGGPMGHTQFRRQQQRGPVDPRAAERARRERERVNYERMYEYGEGHE